MVAPSGDKNIYIYKNKFNKHLYIYIDIYIYRYIYIYGFSGRGFGVEQQTVVAVALRAAAVDVLLAAAHDLYGVGGQLHVARHLGRVPGMQPLPDDGDLRVGATIRGTKDLAFCY